MKQIIEYKHSGQPVYYRILWQYTAEGEVRLLRMYGQNSQVIVPQEICGSPVRELANYCFAAAAHLPKRDTYEESWFILHQSRADSDVRQVTWEWQKLETSGQEKIEMTMTELCGSYVAAIWLPDALRTVGSLAFYNCTKLEQLCIGASTVEFGSDTFMNCHSLRSILVRCEVTQKSGVRQMLAQIPTELEVSYVGAQVQARLLYPEYFESYDEIAPAHIFGRNISGEGFRARQSFTDGVINFVQYDAIFAKACAEESVRVLSQMALDRLIYPAGLSSLAKSGYQEYLQAHDVDICKRLTDERMLAELEYMCKEQLLSEQALAEGMELAARAGWAEGTASMIAWKNRYYQKKDAAERYSFDDF